MIDPRRDFQHFVRQFADESAALRNSMDALRSHFQAVTQHDLKQMECRLMEAIQQFSGRVNAAFDKIGKSVDGISADVDALKKKLDEINNNPGTLTPADQAALDDAIGKAESLASKLEALDAATEEVPTPNPGGPTPPS